MQLTLRHSGFRIGLPYRNKIAGEMTYPIVTIDLVAEVLYDLTTTIPSGREIYNVLPDYGGADANVSVTWAIVGNVWHVYFYSVDTLTDVKIKIIYK